MAEADIPIIRVCTKCGGAKPANLEFFCKAKLGKFGLTAVCKQCGRADKAARRLSDPGVDHRYYIANRERLLAQMGEYSKAKRSEQGEEVRAYWAEYRAKNKDKITVWQKRYEADNRARITRESRDRLHARFEADPSLKAAYYARIEDHRRANREAARSYVRNRRAAIKGLGGIHTKNDINGLFAMQCGKCWYCQKKLTNYHVDHRIPIAKGGRNGPENLVLACPRCNQTKGAKMPWEADKPRLI